MTQPPPAGTASQQHTASSDQSNDSGGATKTEQLRTQRGPAGSGAGASGNAGGSDFGQTTISGSPRQGTAGAPGNNYGLSGTAFSQSVGAPQQPAAAASGAQQREQSARSTSGRGARRGPRRARLQLRHISPLTVLKFSCVLAIALFFVWLIIVGVLYGVLDAAGVIQKVNDTVVQLNGSGSKPPITAGIVFGGAAIVGVVNIVLFVALTTIGSVIYNLCADLVGGIEITLSER
jgi:hypothetical protein